MDTDRSAVKRSRSLSSSSESSVGSDSRSVSYSPPPKYHRASGSPSKRGSSIDFVCTLPPTCSNTDSASSYATQEDLERHQNAFHKWICRTPVRDKSVPRDKAQANGESSKVMVECGKVFPEERLLTLHQTETHDPQARQRQDDGEKIFCCFLPVEQCKKKFINPQRRRHHMIDKHHYPRDYFFSITNHGINQMAATEGLAMSLIRPRRYKPRNRTSTWKDKKGQGGKNREIDMDQEASTSGTAGLNKTPDHTQPPDRTANHVPATSSSLTEGNEDRTADVDMDGLTAQLGDLDSSLQFKPRGVRKKAIAKPGIPRSDSHM